MRRFLLLLAVAFLLPSRSRGADGADYVRDIKPLLKQRCFACHGALKQKGNLRLDAAALIRKGGRHGPAVVAGNSAGSLLLERAADAEPSSRMPPEGQPLTPAQLAQLKAWIDAGAAAPANDAPEEDPRQHWAFQPPARPTVPRRPWGRNAIDAFLADQHARKGLSPVPAADPATLLRRVYLDVIGLPPSREQLHAFLADPSPDAYERVVDRLLESPQYGERWARHWMDVWRYSDWYGRRAVPDVMNSYAQIWRWRDWIVRSLNADQGYDRMVTLMLAADEVAPEDGDALAATGFLVRNWFKWNYNQWMRDNVEHTGKAFLGLTLNCCHCHDHKYDPVTQEEYFRFRAFFEPLELRHDRVAGEPDPGPFQKYVYGKAYGPITSGRIRVFDEKLDAATFFYAGGDERNRVAGKPPVAPGAPAALGGERLKVEPIPLPPSAWNPALQPFVQREETAKREAAVATAERALARARQTLAEIEPRSAEAKEIATALRIVPPAVADVLARQKRATQQVRLAGYQLAVARADLAWLQARLAADHAAAEEQPKHAIEEIASAASRAERQYQLDAALLAQLQAETAGSNAKAAADKVAACRKNLAAESTTYTPLTPRYPRTSTGRRAALARWIASRDNPLTARVAVNHLWNWHFGRPLVETTFNFGRSGQRPSHPELLDWLAAELMDNGWRLKHLHRLILTSEAYRLRSSATGAEPANRKLDPDNRFLWHFPTGRMEAEVVRDSLLYVSGDLDATMGGPEIPQAEGLKSRRRSLYFAHHGESRMEFLDLFDAANPCDAYRRTTSVLPQQALALSNSDLAIQQGRSLARKLWQAVGAASEAAFIQAAFEQVLGRPPTPAESAASAAFLRRQVEVLSPGQTDSAGRARENLVHALFNHNDFVTIR